MAPWRRLMAEVALAAKDCQRLRKYRHIRDLPICADLRRATGEICVVEDVADLWAMERGQVFQGTLPRAGRHAFGA
jgi:recombination protein RecR